MRSGDIMERKQFQYNLSCKVEIDGYTNFVFTNRYENVYNLMTLNSLVVTETNLC